MLADNADTGPDLVLRLFANRAGVVEHDIRRLPIVCESVAQAPELADDELSVQDIHLAAECLEVDTGAGPGGIGGVAGGRSGRACVGRAASGGANKLLELDFGHIGGVWDRA